MDTIWIEAVLIIVAIVAGFLLQSLSSVPQPGASVSQHGYVWTVVDMDGPRIAKVKAERQR